MDLTIILVNYKNYIDTIDCLKSLFNQKDNQLIPVKIIIVDNYSCNPSLSEINSYILKKDSYKLYTTITFENKNFSNMVEHNSKEFSLIDITLIDSRENNGFAAGNNIALEFVSHFNRFSNFYWFLNSDTIVEKFALENIINYLKINSNKKLGLIGTKLFDYYNPTKLQGIGGMFLSTGITKHIGSGQEDIGQFDTINYQENCNYPIGASMIASNDYICNVGRMREDLFLYCEEIDWALRGANKGWKLDFIPSLKVFHKEGGSSKEGAEKKSDLADYYGAINRVKILEEYFNLSKNRKIAMVTVQVVKRLFAFKIKRASKLLKYYISIEK